MISTELKNSKWKRFVQVKHDLLVLKAWTIQCQKFVLWTFLNKFRTNLGCNRWCVDPKTENNIFLCNSGINFFYSFRKLHCNLENLREYQFTYSSTTKQLFNVSLNWLFPFKWDKKNQEKSKSSFFESRKVFLTTYAIVPFKKQPKLNQKLANFRLFQFSQKLSLTFIRNFLRSFYTLLESYVCNDIKIVRLGSEKQPKLVQKYQMTIK